MSDVLDQWQRIGDRLRQAREYLELKQEEAAEAVGVSRSALSQIENGHRKVDAMELSRFAKLYGQSIESLTGSAKLPPLPQDVHALARAAAVLSPNDQAELLRFAQFLQARNPKSVKRG